MSIAFFRAPKLAALGAAAILSVALLSIGTASAAGPEVRIGSLEMAVGEQGTVILEAVDIPTPGLGAWTVDIAYDPGWVSPVDCEALNGGVCNIDFEPTDIRVTGVSAFGLEGTTPLAELTFACDDDGTAELTVKNVLLADATTGEPQPFDAAATSGTIVCSAAPEPDPTPEPTPPVEEGLPGDADCNGVVDALDAVLVLQFEAFLIDELPCHDNANINDDVATDSVDALIILQISAGLV